MNEMNEMQYWSENVLRFVGPRGPYPHEYAGVTLAFTWVRKWVENYKDMVKNLIIDPHENWLANEDDESRQRPYFNLILHVWYQPHGYAGDGDLLTKLYRALDTPDLDSGGEPMNPWVFSRWDAYVASRPEVLAIQSRKEYVVNMAQFCANKGMTSWLDVGCGTGEFTKQVIMEQGDRIDRVCGIDNDSMSIGIARHRTGFTHSVELVKYEEMNILTTLPKEEYDAIYCTGLFDYLNDETAIKTLKRFLTLKPRCIMIGNMQQTPDTTAIMECFGWKLINRDVFDLVVLAQEVLPGVHCGVETDRTGIQHFLTMHVDKIGRNE